MDAFGSTFQPEPSPIFRPGDLVCLGYRGQTVEAEVFLVTPTGRKVTLLFEGELGQNEGIMIVIWRDRRYVDFFDGER